MSRIEKIHGQQAYNKYAEKPKRPLWMAHDLIRKGEHVRVSGDLDEDMIRLYILENVIKTITLDDLKELVHIEHVHQRTTSQDYCYNVVFRIDYQRWFHSIHSLPVEVYRKITKEVKNNKE